MTALANPIPFLSTCSQVDQARFVPIAVKPVVRLTRAETASVLRRLAKIDEVLASHYHVKGSDVRFNWQILKEKDRLQKLLRSGRPSEVKFADAVAFSKQTIEATTDYAHTITTYSYSAMYGVREGFEQLAKKLTALAR